ncbi:hypothetical protein CYMTET_14183 [Cymbomonas tetramitiformis]|uniref:Uncharacterized protein n=1 Tax=Cymbomonas tetramitiformis TaxID=36881 RepID=A0AAE0LAF8_9CHLO|nr:hypothetical protein CYMTET_14183 [Cymbomonas tetramitiformis]
MSLRSPKSPQLARRAQTMAVPVQGLAPRERGSRRAGIVEPQAHSKPLTQGAKLQPPTRRWVAERAGPAHTGCSRGQERAQALEATATTAQHRNASSRRKTCIAYRLGTHAQPARGATPAAHGSRHPGHGAQQQAQPAQTWCEAGGASAKPAAASAAGTNMRKVKSALAMAPGANDGARSAD